MKTANGINLTMLCDYYELTMGNGYWKANMSDRITYFDVFFRSIPDSGGFAIAAGLEQIVDYVRNLHFSEEDLTYFTSTEISGLCRKGRPFSRVNRSSQSARLRSRRSCWRPICCWSSTTKA